MSKKVDWVSVLNDAMNIAPDLFGIDIDLSALIKAAKGESQNIEAKAEQAATALHEASLVVTELQNAIESEIQKVSSVKKEYEKYQGLASISEEQSKALLKQLEHVQNQGRGKMDFINNKYSCRRSGIYHGYPSITIHSEFNRTIDSSLTIACSRTSASCACLSR